MLAKRVAQSMDYFTDKWSTPSESETMCTFSSFGSSFSCFNFRDLHPEIKNFSIRSNLTIFIIKTEVFYKDFQPDRNRNSTREKLQNFFHVFDITNQLLTHHLPFLPLMRYRVLDSKRNAISKWNHLFYSYLIPNHFHHCMVNVSITDNYTQTITWWVSHLELVLFFFFLHLPPFRLKEKKCPGQEAISQSSI